MAKPKKTIPLNDLIDIANDMIRDSAPADTEFRQGVMMLLTTALSKSKNYNGFRFLNKDEVKAGAPGINLGDDLTFEQRFANTDSTRVCYFRSK